jgi:ATP-dependent Clp protease ATP-binding subunit ClpC
VLGTLDVELEDVRARVAELVGRGEEVTTGQIPFTPRAKRVLELALREALNLGHEYIGTEHVLLGLVREDGVAARILLDLGVDADKARNEVVRTLGGRAAHPSSPGVFTTGGGLRQHPRRRFEPVALLVAGGALFGLALGVGILVGWLIWG